MKKRKCAVCIATGALLVIACLSPPVLRADEWRFAEAPFSYIQKWPYETAEWTIVQPGATRIRVFFDRAHFVYSRPEAFEDEKSKIEIIRVSEFGIETVVRDVREERRRPFAYTVDGDTVKIRYTAGANGGRGIRPSAPCPEWRADAFEVQGYSYFSGDEVENINGPEYRIVEAPEADTVIHTLEEGKTRITVARPNPMNMIEGGDIKVDFFYDDLFLGSSRGLQRGGDLFFSVELDLEEAVALGRFRFRTLRLEERYIESLIEGRETIKTRTVELDHGISFEDLSSDSNQPLLRRGRGVTGRAVLELAEAGMVHAKAVWQVLDGEDPADVDLFLLDGEEEVIASSTRHGIQEASPGTFSEAFSLWLDPGVYTFEVDVPGTLDRGIFYARFPEDGRCSPLEPLDDWEDVDDATGLIEPGMPRLFQYRFTPPVFRTGQAQAVPVTLEAEIDGRPDSAVLRVEATGDAIELLDDGDGGDAVAGDDIYSVTIPGETVAAFLRAYSRENPRTNRKKFGSLTLRKCGWARHKGIWGDVLGNDIPMVQVVPLADDVQFSEHLVNIVDPDHVLSLEPADIQDVCRTFYRHFDDDYDYINIFPAVHNHVPITGCGEAFNSCHRVVRNTVEGIGRALTDRTADYGSAGRLLGITPYEDPLFFDGASWLYQHEFGHTWANFLGSAFPLMRDNGYCGCHWPDDSSLQGIMGGGGYEYLQRNDFRRRTYSGGYADLSLYLMGMIPPDDVGRHYVFLERPERVVEDGTEIYRGDHDSFTIDELIRSVGARVPGHDDAPKRFRMATIVVSDELLSEDEMRFYDYFSGRAEETRLVHTRNRSWADDGLGEAKRTKPFYLSTRRVGRLDTRIIDELVQVNSCTPEEMPLCPIEDPGDDEEFAEGVITVYGNGFSPEHRIDFDPHGRGRDCIEEVRTRFVNPWTLKADIRVPLDDDIFEPGTYDVLLYDQAGNRLGMEEELVELQENCCLKEFLDRILGAAGGGDDGGEDNDTLRAFRDGFLQSSPDGSRLIESYYLFGGELIKICTEDPGLAKEAALLLRTSSVDLEILMKYGSPGLSPLDPANLKLVSEETIDGARGLLAIFKNRASTELRVELDRFEKELLMGKSGSRVIDDKTLMKEIGALDPVESSY